VAELTARALDNSTSSSYIYDAMDRVLNVTHALVGATRTLAYGYDVVGNRTFVRRDGRLGDTYGYDLADQVNASQFNIANPDTAGSGSVDVVYDATGNRTAFPPTAPLTRMRPPITSINIRAATALPRPTTATAT
jgi:uncharacterized protein RhaS with RHS repeats